MRWAMASRTDYMQNWLLAALDRDTCIAGASVDYFDGFDPQAAGLHPARARLLATDIVDKVHDFGLAGDLGLSEDDGESAVLGKLDGFLCDLKDLQIRDGLHIFGETPTGDQHRDLTLALARAAALLATASSARGAACRPCCPR